MPSSVSAPSFARARDLTIGPYAERRRSALNSVDQALLSACEHARLRLSHAGMRGHRNLTRIEGLAPRFAGMSDAELRAYATGLRPRLLRQGLRRGPIEEAFALVREASGRRLGMRHYPVQLIGGLVLLRGGLAEMATGEGKTLVTLLPAIAAGLAGVPVHVVTVNDYLARRDAEQLRPVYEALGLSVGLVQAGQPREERCAAYACDITYCTNKELVFDYLRDRIEYRKWTGAAGAEAGLTGSWKRNMLLRGLHFCIVDEADSVLVDEARTPLIISAERDSNVSRARYTAAIEIARSMSEGEHYSIALEGRQVSLTPKGETAIAERLDSFEGVWRSKRAREELVTQAVTALELFHLDKHYIVADGKVQIVDEYTGRVMADRSWERGLHQLIELKEGCELSNERDSLAQITYQRFFRRYMVLSGMTGTAREVAGEMRAIYGLRTTRIPTNKPIQRRDLGVKLLATAAEKWEVVASAAQGVAAEGRPVLIGTRSVAASERIARLLDARGVPHVVLNARQDQAEAATVAQAGQTSRITVATNMAGRGTDILLGPGVGALGGLHVILTEFHESARIDRQLIGRAGRQGDPGSFEAITSLEDEIFVQFAPAATRLVASRKRADVHPRVSMLLARLAHRAAERYNSRIRRQIVSRDQELDKAFAFAGQPD